jgi:GAF domain-containing protein
MTKTDNEGTMGDGFKPAPVPDNEAERLREVSTLGLTGFSRNDPNLNDIIRIACAVADTPIAMVNILDRPDQHTLRSCGLPEAAPTPVPTKDLNCQIVLAHSDVLIIEDLRKDERTKNHPFVDPPTSMLFYAGAPLVGARANCPRAAPQSRPQPASTDSHIQ